jgi:hypothetical protein
VSALSIVGLITDTRMSDVGTPTITLPSPVDISFNHPPSLDVFGRISEVVVFEAVAGYCGSQGGGPLGPFS